MVEQREAVTLFANFLSWNFSRICDGRGGPQCPILHVNEHKKLRVRAAGLKPLSLYIVTSSSVKEGLKVVHIKTTSVIRELSCTCFKPEKNSIISRKLLYYNMSNKLWYWSPVRCMKILNTQHIFVGRTRKNIKIFATLSLKFTARDMLKTRMLYVTLSRVRALYDAHIYNMCVGQCARVHVWIFILPSVEAYDSFNKISWVKLGSFLLYAHSLSMSRVFPFRVNENNCMDNNVKIIQHHYCS